MVSPNNISIFLGPGQYLKKYISGGSAPGSKPLLFHILVLTEKITLSFTFDRKLVPLSHTCRRNIASIGIFLIFHFKNPLKYFNESTTTWSANNVWNKYKYRTTFVLHKTRLMIFVLYTEWFNSFCIPREWANGKSAFREKKMLDNKSPIRLFYCVVLLYIFYLLFTLIEFPFGLTKILQDL